MATTTNAKPAASDAFDAYEVLLAPLASEKCIRAIEFANVLTFAVNPRATKRDVKRAVEELFKVTVVKVAIQNAVSGRKKAYVTLGANSVASDVSAELGFI